MMMMMIKLHQKLDRTKQIHPQKQTYDPQKTPKIPHYKANTTIRERKNAGKYNFGSKPNPNYTNVYNLNNNSDTNSTSLTLLA